MAIFIPTTMPVDFDGFNNSPGEKAVYKALQTLDDSFTVFYSLKWIGINKKRFLGEADFVALHPDMGILVIEVKSGGIELKNGEWWQTSNQGHTNIIFPFDQARKSQFELLERIKSDSSVKCPLLCYCVWFPSIEFSVNQHLPTEASREIILDRNSLTDPEQSISDCFNFWGKMNPNHKVSLNREEFKNLISSISPNFHIIPKLKTQIEETEDLYIQLTKQQSLILDYLEEQETAAINGFAGTGKTVLAVEKALRLSSSSESVLFLCFNTLLRDSLRSNPVTRNVTYHHVYSLAQELKIDTDGDISKLTEYIKESSADDWKYKHIVIDEGQDLDPELMKSLKELTMKKKGCFYVFYDKNQAVISDKSIQWLDNADCKLVLHKNCRNTASIFKTSCRFINQINSNYNQANGPKPGLTLYSTDEAQASFIDKYIVGLTAEGIKPDDIVILTARTIESSPIDVDRTYGCVPLSKKKEVGKIFFTTIRKFKGLESRFVLIVDASMKELLKLYYRNLIYVGASRATQQLQILMHDDMEIYEFIRKFDPTGNLPRNKNGLAKLFKVDI